MSGEKSGKVLHLPADSAAGAVATGKQQAAVAGGEEFGGFFRGGDTDAVRIGAKGALVEVGEVAHAGGEIRADRQ